jgi:Icc protein
MNSASHTILQISDSHLVDAPTDILRGICPYENLRHILDVAATYEPAALVLTGDLAEAGAPSAYQQLQELLNGWQIPIYYIAGNHDDATALNASLMKLNHYGIKFSFRLGQWQIISVDSVKLNASRGEGAIAPETYAWLKEQISQYSDRSVLIVLHHYPFIPYPDPDTEPEISWLNQIALDDSAQFRQFLAQFPQVKLCLSGHGHREMHYEEHGITFYGCPSTLNQVTTTKEQETNLELCCPGFRWLKLADDGTYATGIHRIDLSHLKETESL